MKNNDVQILIECKKIGEPLNINHASQLFRYFHVTNARISILTNGQIYRFYTDLDAPNKMDEKPFLEVDLLDIDENVVPELKKLTKSSFDLESIINAAGELKYVSQIKRILHSQLNNPEDDFVKFFASRVYDGMLTQKVRESFLNLTKKAASQYINDQVNERLKSAITGIAPTPIEPPIETQPLEEDDHKDENDIVTTLEELEGFHIVKAITRTVLEAPRITHRQKKGLAEIHLHNLRDYTLDKWKRVDDYPYGGSAGMVMQCEPIDRCIAALKAEREYDDVIYVSPDGETFNQKIANEMSMQGNLIILCGHYKGIDQRVRDHLITREISVGDYVLTGGELAAAIISDAVIRLVPGVISDEQSALSDCFQDDILAAPIYTRPADYKGWKVPEILLSGNEAKIRQWEFDQAMERTKRLRPDLLK